VSSGSSVNKARNARVLKSTKLTINFDKHYITSP
jgi:hypothetical protein